MKRVLTVIITAAFLMLAAPAAYASDQPLPDLTGDNTSGYTTTFYGTDDIQQAWLTYEVDLLNTDPGYILGVFESIDLTPYRSYFWGRTSGSLDDILTEDNSEDFIAGIEFLVRDISDDLILYAAEEAVVFTSAVDIDHAYTGVGLKWTSDYLAADAGGWYDIDDNYRLTLALSYSPSSDICIEPSVWAMIDHDDSTIEGSAYDVWAWWRVTTSYTISEDVDIIGLYEHSTRSEPLYMIGLSHSF